MTKFDVIKDFERRVLRFIEDNDLPRPDDLLVVGLSGGADSTALAMVLSALGYRLVAAHCNFRLRGEESRRDSRQARHIADRLDIDIHVRDFDVPARMAATGESLEMACRSLRYEWFLELLDRHRARAVAIGHHREDNAETLLLNLLRGTGTAGLAGIRPRRDYVIRPLLEVSRGEIEQYLRARDISWVDDSSNASDAFRRNALRLRVLPGLERDFPGAMDAIVRTARNVAASNALSDIAVSRLIGDYLTPCDDGTLRVDCSAIVRDFGLHLGGPATTLIFEIIRRHGFGIDTARSVMRALATATTGQYYSSPDYEAWLDRGTLILEPSSARTSRPDETVVSLARDILSPVHIVITEHPVADFAPVPGDNSVLYLDTAALDGDPVFTIRPWRQGDRLEPFGMNGRSKLVSDIFADSRLSPRDKERALLLCRDGVPLWIIGLRASRHFPVTPATRRYLTLHHGRAASCYNGVAASCRL